MKTGKIFFGILVIFLGVIFLLDTMNIVENAWRFWPLLVILAGVFIIISVFTNKEPWWKTEDGWHDFGKKLEEKFGDEKNWEEFGKKMEKTFGDEKKWEKVGKKMEKVGEEISKGFSDIDKEEE